MLLTRVVADPATCAKKIQKARDYITDLLLFMAILYTRMFWFIRSLICFYLYPFISSSDASPTMIFPKLLFTLTGIFPLPDLPEYS